MGIRFDMETAKPTNAPTLFFNSFGYEYAVENEIRKACHSRLSFYAYRMPGMTLTIFGSSESVVEGLGVPGFVVAHFDPSIPFLTIPFEKTGIPRTGNSGAFTKFHFPDRSTSPEEHASEIAAIKDELLRHKEGKIVATRAILKEKAINVGATFNELCHRNPDAFVFCFSTPQTGCWIGATPELLLKNGKGVLSTMSLAGTKPADSTEPWDEKNIEEQAIVTSYIAETLHRHGLSPFIGDTFTRSAGKVAHICTPIEAATPAGFSFRNLDALLHDLSPTPALCGFPKEEALDVIRKHENFDRGCYGGFCGPCKDISDFSLFVSIRCAAVEENRFCIFAGGGITLKSDEASEWKETEIKSATISDSLRKK